MRFLLKYVYGYCHKKAGGQSFNSGGTGNPSDYRKHPARGNPGKEGCFMSDYELLSIVLMILGIIVSIVIAYINHTKK